MTSAPKTYHYGRNWKVPGDGEYTLRVHIEPPTFMRHDELNGRRFEEPVDVELKGGSGQDRPGLIACLGADRHAARDDLPDVR